MADAAATQVQSRLAAHALKTKDLSDWLTRFELLMHSVDGSRSIEEVYGDCRMHVVNLMDAKDAADAMAENAAAAKRAAEVRGRKAPRFTGVVF